MPVAEYRRPPKEAPKLEQKEEGSAVITLLAAAAAAAPATMEISVADASSGVDTNPDAINPPSPSPMITPLVFLNFVQLIKCWLKDVEAPKQWLGLWVAIKGSPRLSPSAISAICLSSKGWIGCAQG